MITIIFYWIGIVGALLIGIALLVVFISLLIGCGYSAFRHGEMLYNRSKMCKKVSANIGHSCALWLIHYNERRGFKFSGYSAGDWERYFGQQLKRKKDEQ